MKLVQEEKLGVSSEDVPTEKAGFINYTPSRHRLWRYGPLILWAAVIFIGSSSVLSASNTSIVVRSVLWLFPQTSEESLRLIHFLVRKAGHFTEYAILALLAPRAFRTSSRELLRNRWFWASLLLVVVYSLSDEFHQSFVPSRTGSIYDSITDSVGGLAALVIYQWRRRRQTRLTADQHFKPTVGV